LARVIRANPFYVTCHSDRARGDAFHKSPIARNFDGLKAFGGQASVEYDEG
jgi:hypothetical protein